jgi:HlyD family secretion protein
MKHKIHRRPPGAFRSIAAAAALLAACEGDRPPLMVGTLERDRYELVAEAAEPIVEIAALEGDCLPAGGLVARLDARRTAAELTWAREEERRASARLAELVRGPRSERIAAARAEHAGADAAAAIADREWERARSLAASGVLSHSELDGRRRELDLALASRDAVRAHFDELLEGSTAEELEQARAAGAATSARRVQLEVTLERLEVRAPRSSCVEALPFELGERPPLGAVVAVLLADGPPWARIYVPEPLRARVVPGTFLEVRVDGVAEALSGRVRTVSSDPLFTPHFALTERDRSRLAYLAEVDVLGPDVERLPSGLPLEAALAER